MVSSFHKIAYLIPIGCFFALTILLNTTDPTKSVASILLAFLLIYVLIASVFYILIYLVALRALERDTSPETEPRIRHKRQKAYYIASVVAFAPVCLLAMRSLSTLQPLDFVLVLFLTGLTVFYVLKRTA